jgi:hypothetical protein
MATTGMRFASILSVAIIAMAFSSSQNAATADDQRNQIDPLSNKSPALQQREKITKRKSAPQSPPPQGIAGPPFNDNCENAIAISKGNTAFSTIGATTDGPPHPICLAFGDDQVNQDIWFNYTASQTDMLNISLCGSLYDTRIAVYDGCECPVSDANILFCNDDSCGLQSQVIGISTTKDHCYKIRLGGYSIATGEGNLNLDGPIVRPCGPSDHDCCTTGSPGCNDVACCVVVCSQDAFCCDSAWDLMCVQLADQLCAEPCPSPCTKDNPHDCVTAGGPGCNDVDCCENVCAADPFCCDTAWDGLCVSSAQISCGKCDGCVFCQPGATLELEACGQDQNGGCNSEPFAYQDIACGEAICGTQWATTKLRDTDWYRFSVTECGTEVSWVVANDFPATTFILSSECPPAILATGIGQLPVVASASLIPGQYFAFVAPAVFFDIPCENQFNDYFASLGCDIPCPADIQGPGGGPNGVVDVDDLLKVINNWGACK